VEVLERYVGIVVAEERSRKRVGARD